MDRRLFLAAAVITVALLPRTAAAQERHGVGHRHRARLFRRRNSRRQRQGGQRVDAPRHRRGERRAGRVPRNRSHARHLPHRDDDRRLRAGRPAARARQRPDGRRRAHADASQADRRRGGQRQARGRGRAGGADSAVGHRSEPRRERRRLQRQPPQRADSHGAVLFDQPAELGHQHPRARRAVRPDERRSRAWRRALHRRRLLCASGGSHARLPRHRAHRGAEGTAGHAVRQEHHRGSDQRHDAEAQLHARRRLRAECRRPGLRPGQGVGDDSLGQAGRRPRVVLGNPARRHGLQRPDTGLP